MHLLRDLSCAFVFFAISLLFWATACPHNKPATGAPVIVENRCELPPKPELPTPKAHRPGSGKLICFTAEEANKLRERDAKLKQWIREVTARCGDAAVSEETRDAGSTSQND